MRHRRSSVSDVAAAARRRPHRRHPCRPGASALRQFVARRAFLAGCAIFTWSNAAAAQSEADGALVLLLPVGAQSVGMGQAMVAERPGSEGVWWNPSGIARLTRREAAIHHSETLAARGDAITIVLPTRTAGTVALSLNVLDFGNQQITDVTGQPVGLVLPRNILVAATYAGAIGERASLGLTYKRLQYRVDCTGQCANVSTFSAGTNALDLGAQYELSGAPVRLGAAIRNIGSRLRITDGDDADPLPTRVEIGASYRLEFIKSYVSDVDFRLAGDIIATEAADDPSARLGAELTYQKTAHLRAGYIANDANGANAALGFGLGAGRLVFDIARTFGGLSADAGKTPAYVSLRYLF